MGHREGGVDYDPMATTVEGAVTLGGAVPHGKETLVSLGYLKSVSDAGNSPTSPHSGRLL